MSKRKKQKQTTTQKILWVLSLVLVGSMVISLVYVAFLPAAPAPTPVPTNTPRATSTARPTATAEPTVVPSAVPTAAVVPTATEPVIGPALPTATVTPTLTVEPTALPTVGPTATPSADASEPALVFAVAGDSRGNPAVYGRVLERVAASGSAFLIHTGDLVNEGEEAQWQAFRQQMAGFALPFFPVPGNHDGLGGRLDGYLKYSGAAAAHYSFDYGPAYFALADSHNGGISAAELAWLREGLSATRQPLKFVVLHHPPFDPDGSDHIMAYGNEAFMALMAELGVDYVLAGHIHAYARAERDGVQYVYTGGGGAATYAEGHPNAFYHYLLVTVQGTAVTVEVMRV